MLFIDVRKASNCTCKRSILMNIPDLIWFRFWNVLFQFKTFYSESELGKSDSEFPSLMKCTVRVGIVRISSTLPRCHSMRGARQQHPWHDRLPISLTDDFCGTTIETPLYQSLQFIGLADDIDIIGRTTSKVCEAYTWLKREAARIRLRINATNTEYLLAGDSEHLGDSVLVDGDNLEVVKEVCYLVNGQRQ